MQVVPVVARAMEGEMTGGVAMAAILVVPVVAMAVAGEMAMAEVVH